MASAWGPARGAPGRLPAFSRAAGPGTDTALPETTWKCSFPLETDLVGTAVDSFRTHPKFRGQEVAAGEAGRAGFVTGTLAGLHRSAARVGCSARCYRSPEPPAKARLPAARRRHTACRLSLTCSARLSPPCCRWDRTL